MTNGLFAHRREENDARQPCTGMLMSLTDETMTTQDEPLPVDQEFYVAESEIMEVRSIFSASKAAVFSLATVDAWMMHVRLNTLVNDSHNPKSVPTFKHPCSFSPRFFPHSNRTTPCRTLSITTLHTKPRLRPCLLVMLHNMSHSRNAKSKL